MRSRWAVQPASEAHKTENNTTDRIYFIVRISSPDVAPSVDGFPQGACHAKMSLPTGLCFQCYSLRAHHTCAVVCKISHIAISPENAGYPTVGARMICAVKVREFANPLLEITRQQMRSHRLWASVRFILEGFDLKTCQAA